MGSGASMYETPEEALAAGVSQADIDTFLKENPNAPKNEAASQLRIAIGTLVEFTQNERIFILRVSGYVGDKIRLFMRKDESGEKVRGAHILVWRRPEKLRGSSQTYVSTHACREGGARQRTYTEPPLRLTHSTYM